MKFFTSLLSTVLAATVAVSAMPAADSVQVVWNPKITSPIAGTQWSVGTKVNITWDTSDEPAGALPGSAKLGINGVLKLEDPNFDLADNLDLSTGFVEVTVPHVLLRNDYTVTLFGDSGNVSPEFSITF